MYVCEGGGGPDNSTRATYRRWGQVRLQPPPRVYSTLFRAMSDRRRTTARFERSASSGMVVRFLQWHFSLGRTRWVLFFLSELTDLYRKPGRST